MKGKLTAWISQRGAVSPVQPPAGPTVATPLSWVTKSNVTDYLRCPYAFWLLDRKQITRAELVSPFQQQLIDRGVAFEKRVVDGARPVELKPGEEAEYLRGDHRLVTTGRMFRNVELRLRGSPDGILSASGAVEPIEIKSHRRVVRSDVIELAFYWRLLQPVRTRSSEPAGWIYLRMANGSVREERVGLAADVFDELDILISGVRHARIHGVEPRRCRCQVCSVVRRDVVQRHVVEKQDISAIWGIGRTYGPLVREFGVESWEELRAADPLLLAAHLREAGMTGVSERVVLQWQAHAEALKEGTHKWVGGESAFPVPNEYIALDLEYNAEAKDVWLVGARVVKRGGHVVFSCWTDSAGNAQAFAALERLLAEHPRLPVVTWNGLSADLPMLRAAAARCGLDRLGPAIDQRHLDLYDWQRRNLMLPIMDFGLKALSEWAGIQRETDVLSGGRADALHSRYLRTGDVGIREHLLDYSREDVDGLVQLTEFLRALVRTGGRPTVAPLPDAATVLDLIFEEPVTPKPFQPRPMRPKPPGMAQERYDSLVQARERRFGPGGSSDQPHSTRS